VAHAVAPQVGSEVLQVALQQKPDPLMPHMPGEAH